MRFYEEFMGAVTDSYSFEAEEPDEQQILIAALLKVLPKIVENELTQKQRICFEMFYKRKLNQNEIAQLLHLSQPTVSRHIKSACAIVKKIISYCYLSVDSANDMWIQIENNSDGI